MKEQVDVKDAQDNKIMGVLAYLGILVLVPILAAKESKFARFHANQGVILLICGLAYGIVAGIVGGILGAIFIAMNLGWLAALIMGVIWLGSLLLLVLMIIGIINAVKGEMKELPFIGKYRIIK